MSEMWAVYACDPRTQEAEEGELPVWLQPGPCLKKQNDENDTVMIFTS